MRRELVNNNADVRPDYHYPIDVLFDVVKNGHNQFGFVKIQSFILRTNADSLNFEKTKKICR